MKNLFVFLLMISPLQLVAQNRFTGNWCDGKTRTEFDELAQHLKIHATTMFNVVDNQLDLECKNVYKSDTLYLYVIDSDQGRGFTGPKYYPPEHNSLFAKCYIIKKEMRIIYTQKLFYDNIKSLRLCTVMYKH